MWQSGFVVCSLQKHTNHIRAEACHSMKSIAKQMLGLSSSTSCLLGLLQGPKAKPGVMHHYKNT